MLLMPDEKAECTTWKLWVTKQIVKYKKKKKKQPLAVSFNFFMAISFSCPISYHNSNTMLSNIPEAFIRTINII